MEEERRKLVQTMEDQRVLPDNDGEHQGSHTEDIVCLMTVISYLLINTRRERETHFEPVDVGHEEESLQNNGEVDEVTEIQHEELEFILGVGDQSPQQEGRHDCGIVKGEPVSVSQSQPLRATDAENTEGEGEFVDHLDLGDFLHVVSDTLVRIPSHGLPPTAGDFPLHLVPGLHPSLQHPLGYRGYRAEVDGAGYGQMSAERYPPVSSHSESEQLVMTVHHVEDLTRRDEVRLEKLQKFQVTFGPNWTSKS